MIYFVQPIDGGPVKIGYSANVPVRVRQLELHYNCPLAVLAVIDGDLEDEAELHERFGHLRFGRTEQFQPAVDLMAFIGKPLFASAVPVVEMEPRETDRTIITMRCTGAFKSHLDGIATKEQRLSSVVIERALRDYTEKHGYEQFPDR